ncbi:hypothetical protein HMPREF3227_00521 [Corynebacterium sp. CMW7794]|uniref:hypothetical protein n=1 Tax=Corynebacterium sp. CMW7794 TaxID=1603887 RepID=UPI0007990332|nr:hypothetical protein [Corynebacterium sp. CMW7794]KXI19507.1 hypothetical protein HMPREF3227_00521 [Corynebacterium sp. CMW7794]
MGLADAQFSPAIQGAFDNFFNNRTASDSVGIRNHDVNMWDHTAAYFANTPSIIGYGPINEPLGQRGDHPLRARLLFRIHAAEAPQPE